MNAFATKKEAFAYAKPRGLKVYRTSTLYTQPGRGLAVAIWYIAR